MMKHDETCGTWSWNPARLVCALAWNKRCSWGVELHRAQRLEPFGTHCESPVVHMHAPGYSMLFIVEFCALFNLKWLRLGQHRTPQEIERS